MKILDLELDGIFQSCFLTSGGAVTECECGREHVAIDSCYLDDEEGQEMIKDFRERAKTDKNFILHDGVDSIGQIEVAGHYFAEDCECEGWKPYMNFILNNRREIKRFLIQVSDAAQIALEHEKTFNVLKDKKLNVLDHY